MKRRLHIAVSGPLLVALALVGLASAQGHGESSIDRQASFAQIPRAGTSAAAIARQDGKRERKQPGEQQREQGQEPKTSWKALLAALDAKLRDERASTAQRELLVEAFLAKHSKLPRVERRKLEVRLAQFELANRHADDALARFRRIERGCRSSELTLRGRCRLGIAQALELLDRKIAALAVYREVERDFAGTRYARIARSARERLGVGNPVSLGRPLRLPRGLRTSSGQAIRLTGKPSLVLVAGRRVELPRSLRGIGKLSDRLRIYISIAPASLEAWRSDLGKLGLAKGQLIARDLLATLGFTSRPSWLLVDSRGRVVDLQPDTARIRKLLRR